MTGKSSTDQSPQDDPVQVSPVQDGPVQISDVAFDFCGVLLDWQIHTCLDGFADRTTVSRICAADDPYGFLRYEDRMDAGEDFADIIDDYRDEYGARAAELFEYYIRHYADSLSRMVPGMEPLLVDLKRAGYGVWGLTNWSHETFHTAFERFPELRDLLDGTLVSGVEKRHKPNPDFYELAFERFHLIPNRTVFFDDSHDNVLAASALGMQAFDFTDAVTARRQLTGLGVSISAHDAAAIEELS